jgi:Tfp pilus assembly protein FimV
MTAQFFPAAAVCLGEIEVRLGPSRPSHAVYVRRRVAMLLVVVGLLILVGFTANEVLADRGAVPASSPAIRPAQAALPPPAGPGFPSPANLYVVRSGDTLWSIAEQFHGHHSVTDYVDELIASNGGTSLQSGQALTLP